MAISRAILGPSWGHLGPSWAILDHFWAILDYLGALLRPSWAHLGPSWGLLGVSLDLSWAMLSHTGATLDHKSAKVRKCAKTYRKITISREEPGATQTSHRGAGGEMLIQGAKYHGGGSGNGPGDLKIERLPRTFLKHRFVLTPEFHKTQFLSYFP